MEPLNDKTETAATIEIESKPRSPTKAPNRIAISEPEWQLLDAWLIQVNTASKGFLTLTKADVIGFLQRNHAKELSAKEISQIRSAFYDPIRHMQWIGPQLKVALETGDHQKVLILQDELKQVEISICEKAAQGEPIRSETAFKKKYKQRKKHENQDQTTAQSSDRIEDLQSETPEA